MLRVGMEVCKVCMAAEERGGWAGSFPELGSGGSMWGKDKDGLQQLGGYPQWGKYGLQELGGG